MIPVVDERSMHARDASDTVTVNEYHESLGHPNMVVTKSTAKARDVELVGDTLMCEDYGTGKAQRKSLFREPVERAKNPGDRIFLDISSPKTKSIGGNNNWLLVLDDATNKPFSFFLKTKDMLSNVLVPWIKELKEKHNITVKIVRCDNAGENEVFEEACKQKGLGISFEYTAPRTPEQNG